MSLPINQPKNEATPLIVFTAAGVPNSGLYINRTLQVIVIVSVLIFSIILILSAFGYTVEF
jgi:hypothetical protein